MAACLRADASRFAAHKAVYVEKKIAEETDDTKADAMMRTFHQWSETEGGYMAQCAQMAGKWQNFEENGDRYYLQYRTAADEKVRDSHAILHNITLPVNDPFWNEYLPPNGWNCRCTVVQVKKDKYKPTDSDVARFAGEQATVKTPSFKFNPGKERKLFKGDSVSYFKHAGANRAERDKTESHCKNMSMSLTVATAKEQLLDTTTECTVNGEQKEVVFISQGIREYAQSMQKTRQFWLKNEILPNIKTYIKNSIYVGKKVSDTSHNTRKQTLRLKNNTDYFYYFKTNLPNGDALYIHLGRYKEGHEKAGKYYFYTVTKLLPINTETP